MKDSSNNHKILEIRKYSHLKNMHKVNIRLYTLFFLLSTITGVICNLKINDDILRVITNSISAILIVTFGYKSGEASFLYDECDKKIKELKYGNKGDINER